jgi:hypothetical protein
MVRRQLSMLNLHPDTIEVKLDELSGQLDLFIQQLRGHMTQREECADGALLRGAGPGGAQGVGDSPAEQLHEGEGVVLVM